MAYARSSCCPSHASLFSLEAVTRFDLLLPVQTHRRSRIRAQDGPDEPHPPPCLRLKFASTKRTQQVTENARPHPLSTEPRTSDNTSGPFCMQGQETTL